MPKIYIIAGCNGAGKTTASYTVLPEILGCREFVNADNIAVGLSPFNPERVAFEAGRLMLKQIWELMEDEVDFAFETTLATRSYVSFIKEAKKKGYEINLLYFWLKNPEFAIQRVAQRVSKGGHNIPNQVIIRRYYRGIKNLFDLYIPVCDTWMVIDNMDLIPEIIAQNGLKSDKPEILDENNWDKILKQRDEFSQ